MCSLEMLRVFMLVCKPSLGLFYKKNPNTLEQLLPHNLPLDPWPSVIYFCSQGLADLDTLYTWNLPASFCEIFLSIMSSGFVYTVVCTSTVLLLRMYNIQPHATDHTFPGLHFIDASVTTDLWLL